MDLACIENHIREDRDDRSVLTYPLAQLFWEGLNRLPELNASHTKLALKSRLKIGLQLGFLIRSDLILGIDLNFSESGVFV